MTQIAPKIQCFRPTTSPTSDPVLDWIDRELVDTYHGHQGRGGNCLLELRQIFRLISLNSQIASFYRLLPRLETTHFLLGYRIRQWISLNFEIRVSDPLNRVSATTVPIVQTQRCLPDQKRHFFEHAAEAIPLGDIRVEIRKAS